MLHMQNISALTLGAILSSEACDTRTLEVGYQIWASATVFTRIRGTVVDILKEKGEVISVKMKHAHTLSGFATPLLHDELSFISKTKVVTLMTTSFSWQLSIQDGSTSNSLLEERQLSTILTYADPWIAIIIANISATW